MRYPLDNLGEYNLARDAVKACGGSFKTVIAEAGLIGAMIATPIAIAGTLGVVFGGKKIVEKHPEKVLKVLNHFSNEDLEEKLERTLRKDDAKNKEESELLD